MLFQMSAVLWCQQLDELFNCDDADCFARWN